jgi:phosphoglycerate kinase
VEEDRLNFAAELMGSAAERGVRFLLPVDVAVANETSNEAEVETLSIENIPPHLKIVDIGPQTIKNFADELRGCKTVFWNGPMGIHEIPRFAAGTKYIAELLASIGATTIIGGGSTAEVTTELKLADKMTFVSTGGGASLKFLSGETLPGVDALMDKKR